MKNYVQNFSHQLQDALQIANKAILQKNNSIHNVVVTGLGGSGIGGTILTEIINDSCPVPVTVNKDYFLPAFVNQNTLLIVSSYSGNTEESVAAMQEALNKKAKIVCITSGGKILELAKQHQLDFIQIPGGMPPRSCIGFSLIQLIKVFVENNLASKDLFIQVENTISLLDKLNSEIKTEALEIAKKLNNKITVIYSLGTCEGVAVRFRQQINENSKMLCWHHSFPEMNHNELVGWTEKNDNLVVVTFKTDYDFERTKMRYEFCKPLFQKLSSGVIEITAKGNSKLEQFFYLINIGDWISCYIADIKGIDAVEVNIINSLKNHLSNQS